MARSIARKVRASSGGLPYVKAIGVWLASRNLAQVSMNLTDFEQMPLHVVFKKVKDEAAALGVGIAGSEMIGLVSSQALAAAGAEFLQIENFSGNLILENHLSALR